MKTKRKVLIVRLGSLGDLVLARDAFMRAYRDPRSDIYDAEIHWIVKRAFSFVLQSDPTISKVWEVPDRISLFEWLQWVDQLKKENFSQIFDLHQTVRSKILCLSFLGSVPIKSVSKERLRMWGHFLFKKIWPGVLQPTAWWIRYLKVLGATELAKFPHIWEVPNRDTTLQSQCAVMPSSRWAGKQWPVDEFEKLFSDRTFYPIVLGQSSDLASVELCERFEKSGVPFKNLIGAPITETVQALKSAIAYVGCDTGLFHWAESVGTPSFVVMGPTDSQSGFGPRLKKSKVFGSHLQCRPCSKDGSICYWIGNPYRCMRDSSENSRIRAEIRIELERLRNTQR